MGDDRNAHRNSNMPTSSLRYERDTGAPFEQPPQAHLSIYAPQTRPPYTYNFTQRQHVRSECTHQPRWTDRPLCRPVLACSKWQRSILRRTDDVAKSGVFSFVWQANGNRLNWPKSSVHFQRSGWDQASFTVSIYMTSAFLGVFQEFCFYDALLPGRRSIAS